ncbi:MAG: methyltransferase [Acidimicrobiia bacterium]
MTDSGVEPGSFRDPATRVFYAGGRVFRGLDEIAAGDWTALSETSFFPTLLAEGKAVGTRSVELTEVPDGQAGEFAAVLEHDRIPFVSYPYEWSFEMLRDAALLHLEILAAALGEDVTMKDGYAFNVQWVGHRPVFIDIGSFEPLRSGGPWIGYRQFCRTFLYPLLLEAHLGVPFQRYLLGHLDGLEPTEMRRFFSGRKRFKKGVFRHVFLHSLAESRVTQGGTALKDEMGKAGFGKELNLATVKKLHRLVGRLRSKRAESGWKQYRDTCSYSDDDRAAKDRFIRTAVEGTHPRLSWDLGCNDGAYSRVLAEQGGTVVAVDSDDVTVDALYRSLRVDGPENILPLVMNLVDPSPARGWRNEERRAFLGRAEPDLVLALALVHHLAIAANVPLAEVVSWLRSLGATLIVEFVEPHDPMAAQLLGNKPAGMFDDYRVDVFEKLLEEQFTVTRREALPGGSRTLYLAHPRS